MERADLGASSAGALYDPATSRGRGGQVWSSWWGLRNSSFVFTMDTPADRNYFFFGRTILRFIVCG